MHRQKLEIKTEMWKLIIALYIIISTLTISFIEVHAVKEGWKNVYADRGHPFIASIQYTVDEPTDPNANFIHICTGSIIYQQHILTSASCFDNLDKNAKLVVNLGVTEKDARTNLPMLIRVDQKIVHPEYNKVNQRANIAVLILKDRIKFRQTVQVIRPNPQKLLPGGDGQLYGWNGRLKKTQKNVSKKLLNARVSVLSIDECKIYYPDLLDDQFCIGGQETTNAPCRGTPGIPYQQFNPDIYIPIITGMATYWPENCEGPALFTSLHKYVDFILQFIE